MRLDEKVAVVTGAARGLGAAAATLLAELGAKVVVADIDEDGARAVAKEISEAGGTAVAQHVDLADETGIQAMIDRAVEEFGGLDILDNNAALTDPAHFAHDLDIATMEADVWDRTFAVNVRGTMLATRAAIPHMLKRGGGSIINITSGIGLVGDVGASAYATSKSALIGLTRNVATQQLKTGIRCNAIACGLILTSAARELNGAAVSMYEPHQSRIGEPIDIARVVAFLASEYGSFITGQVIAADGGFLAHVPCLPERVAFIDEALAARS